MEPRRRAYQLRPLSLAHGSVVEVIVKLQRDLLGQFLFDHERYLSRARGCGEPARAQSHLAEVLQQLDTVVPQLATSKSWQAGDLAWRRTVYLPLRSSMGFLGKASLQPSGIESEEAQAVEAEQAA